MDQTAKMRDPDLGLTVPKIARKMSAEINARDRKRLKGLLP